MLRASLSLVSDHPTASPAHKSACSRWTPASLFRFRPSAAPISLPHGLPTARRSFFHLRCRAILSYTFPTSTAAAPNGCPTPTPLAFPPVAIRKPSKPSPPSPIRAPPPPP